MDLKELVRNYIENELQGDITWEYPQGFDFCIDDEEYSVHINTETSTINVRVIQIYDVVLETFRVDISYEGVIKNLFDINDVFDEIIKCPQIDYIKKAMDWVDDAYLEFDADTLNFIRNYL